MKSTTFTAALLASVAVAQPHAPHGHQRRHKHADELEKRELVVEWETVWETATVYVDSTTTETVLPEKTSEPAAPEAASAASTTSTGVPGQFFQTPSTEQQPTTLATSTSSPAAAPPPAQTTTTEAPPAPTTPTTTSTPEPAPEPTTTAAAAPIISVPAISVAPPVVAPSPTTSEEPTTSSVVAPPPAETSGSSGGGGGGGSTGVSGEGDMTFYTVGMGACGYDDTGADETENIVAMPVAMWEAVSSATNLGVGMPAHPWCDKMITIKANGKTAQAKIRDQCPGCAGGSIDVTSHAFLSLFDSLDVGRGSVEWTMDA